MPLPALNAASCCFHRSFGRNEGQEITPLLDNSLLARYRKTQKFNDDLPRDPRITFMAQIMCVANMFAEFDGANDYRNLVLRTQGLQSCKCRTVPGGSLCMCSQATDFMESSSSKVHWFCQHLSVEDHVTTCDYDTFSNKELLEIDSKIRRAVEQTFINIKPGPKWPECCCLHGIS